MTSTFGGLQTALSALQAQRRGLDVTGQNVANANTPGYTRQRVALESVNAGQNPALWSIYDGAGNGVEASTISRLGDELLNSRVRSEHTRLARLTTAETTLGQVEQAFSEPGETGLQQQFSDMWSAWDDVANNPGQSAPRTALLTKSAIVAGTVNQVRSTFATQYDSQRQQLDTVVAAVNTAATSVAELNVAIRGADLANLPANELKDRRDVLALDLATMVGATSTFAADGTLTLSVGGSSLVSGAQARQLGATGSASLAGQAADPVTLRWTDTNAPVAGAGQVGGLMEATNVTLPGYDGKLSAVAAQLATSVNAAHAGGYDLAGAAGGDVFSWSAAGGLAVVITDEKKLAASSSATPAGNLGAGNAAALSALKKDPAGVDATYRQLIVDLGVVSQAASRRTQIQGEVTTQADAARDSQAGVNLDEEMVNLLTYQRAYEGAAKVLSTIDEALQTLINMVGR